MDFFRFKDLRPGENQQGYPNSYLVPLKKTAICGVLKDYTKYGVVQAIYISLFIGVAKNCRYPALLHISSRQRDSSSEFSAECGVKSSVRGHDWKETDIFSAVRDRHLFGKKTAESGGKTDILSDQIEMPNAAKRL